VTLRDGELYRWFDRSPVGWFHADEAGRLHHVNAAFVRLLGYDTAEEVLALNLGRDIYVDPADRARLIERYQPEGVMAGARVRWRTKQGRELVVQIYGHVIEEPEGARFDASVLDVTELETANVALRDQREAIATTATMLELVVRQLTAIYWIVDRDLRICQSGGAIQQLLGFAPGKFHGLTIDHVYRLDPRSMAPGAIDPIAMHRRAVAGETITFATDFRDKHLVTTVCPHRSNDTIIGAIGTCFDATAHHLLERHMVDAQRTESLGVLAAGLAHDFNNLLAVILGNADLALREIAPRGPGRGPLENIRQASLRAAEVTAQLLAYAGRGGVSSTRVSPCPVVEELLRISAPTMPVNVTLCVDIDRDLVLRGDASQIRQVVLNLINNARDALGTRGGTIAITGLVYHHDGTAHADDVVTAAAGTYVELEVADDGPGMDHELRRRIFEPFFTTKPNGHGLGLAAVVGIVRAHGGGLRVDTAPGTGARFQILWPASVTPGELAAVPPPASSHTVLIIDDEDLVRDVVARMVEDLGYATITATDGPSGLAIVEHLSVDAVIVDLTLPRMTNPEVVTALRARRPDLPIILCSSFDRDARAGHADAYLPKPFRLDALKQTLGKLLPR
jgi:two-component system cell cycle sensor histidine kinase/response regulator CckA